MSVDKGSGAAQDQDATEPSVSTIERRRRRTLAERGKKIVIPTSIILGMILILMSSIRESEENLDRIIRSMFDGEDVTTETVIDAFSNLAATDESDNMIWVSATDSDLGSEDPSVVRFPEGETQTFGSLGDTTLNRVTIEHAFRAENITRWTAQEGINVGGVFVSRSSMAQFTGTLPQNNMLSTEIINPVLSLQNVRISVGRSVLDVDRNDEPDSANIHLYLGFDLNGINAQININFGTNYTEDRGQVERVNAEINLVREENGETGRYSFDAQSLRPLLVEILGYASNREDDHTLNPVAIRWWIQMSERLLES